MSERWAVKIIFRDGEEDFVRDLHSMRITAYSRRAAEEQVEFIKLGGMDDFQSVNAMRYPR